MEHGFAIWANPSSPHAEGRRAKVERRIASAVEHDAVFRAAPDAELVPVANGEVDGEALAAALAAPGRAVVAVQHVNSETGTILSPFVEDVVAAKVREAGGLLLRDCAQSAGKVALPEADMLVVSAHKFGGPIGIGALLVRDFALLEPSGGHERGYRQGTENLPGALGMAAALEAGGIDSWASDIEMQLAFKNALLRTGGMIQPGFQSSYILALTHPTLSAQALLIRLDAMGFAVSAGSACSSGTLKKSRVLEAFGVDDETAARTIRVSLGWSTTAEDLERFAQAWTALG